MPTIECARGCLPARLHKATLSKERVLFGAVLDRVDVLFVRSGAHGCGLKSGKNCLIINSD